MDTVQVMSAQVWVPPVAGIVQLPICVPVALSRWSWRTPPAVVAAIRAENKEAQVVKSRFRTRIQSVAAMSVTSRPPSEQASVWMPFSLKPEGATPPSSAMHAAAWTLKGFTFWRAVGPVVVWVTSWIVPSELKLIWSKQTLRW